MSCGCNQTPCCCSGSIAPAACCTPSTESVEYTFENQNSIGIGVFNDETDNLVGFRGIASDTLALTVTLDAGNNAIIISFNDELLIDDIPTFTETVRGIGEAATQAETNAGVADDKIITPLKLNDRTATETRTGIAEIATQAEVNAGTDDERFVTSLKLATFSAQSNTRTFADAVERAAATPAFNGQLGIQLDTDGFYIATGTVAGDFGSNLKVDTTGFTTAGTAANPAIFRSSDADTGVYWAGTNQLAIAASGIQVISFSQNEIQASVTAFFIDGTASDPSIAFVNDSQTGFFNATEVIGVAITGTECARFSAVGLSLTNSSLLVPSTVSVGTGAQIINKMSGTVNFAGAAATLVVTNNLVTTNSIILAQVATVDGTMLGVTVVAGAGSFTLTATPAAPTGTTRVNFLVINPS